MNTYTSVEEYILNQRLEVRELLNNLRVLIKKIDSSLVESISYGMPAYKLNGKPVIYFAVQKTHLGIYPTPIAVSKFKQDLKPYKTSKGAIQLPLNSPIPYKLIEKIVKFKIKDILG